jgi:hypothetical protein
MRQSLEIHRIVQQNANVIERELRKICELPDYGGFSDPGRPPDKRGTPRGQEDLQRTKNG